MQNCEYKKSDLIIVDEIYKKFDFSGLTTMQKKFITNYRGNPSEAARLAGYSSPCVAASRLLNIDKILCNIHIVDEMLEKAVLADSVEILAFWTNILRSAETPLKYRIQASKLIGEYRGLLNNKHSTQPSGNKETTFIVQLGNPAL